MAAGITTTMEALVAELVMVLGKNCIRRKKMNPTLEPIFAEIPEELALAYSAKEYYNMMYELGGESAYPHWADIVINRYEKKGDGNE
jgi:hypothetical protein